MLISSRFRARFFVLCLGVLLALPHTNTLQAQQPEARIVSATVRVDGLTCSLCHRSVYKALKKLEFIENLTPNLDETSLDITFAKNVPISFDRIAEAIEGAGFSIGVLRSSVEFQPTTLRTDEHIPLGNALVHFVNIAKERVVQGRVELTFIDDRFIPDTEAAEWRTKIHHSCYKTGTVEECCPPAESTKPATRVYHCSL